MRQSHNRIFQYMSVSNSVYTLQPLNKINNNEISILNEMWL